LISFKKCLKQNFINYSRSPTDIIKKARKSGHSSRNAHKTRYVFS